MKRFLVLACAALTLGVAGCQDSTNPSAVLSGSYTLRSVANQEVPAVVYADAVSSTEWLSGSITLDRSGSFTDYVRVRETYTSGASPYEYDSEIYGYWTLSGDQLALTYDGDENNPSYAIVSNGELVFTQYTNNGTPYTVIYSK